MSLAEQSGKAPRWKRLIRARWVGVLAIRSLGIAALFGFEITIASSLEVAEYGVFSFSLAIAVVLSRLASLGWLNGTTRLVSAFLSSTRYSLLRGSLIVSHLATGLGLIAAAAVLALVAPRFDILSAHAVLTTVLPLIAALGILELHRYTLRGLDAADLGELLPVLLLPTLAAAAVWSLSIRDSGSAIHAYTLIVFGLIVLSTILVVYRLPAQVWACKAQFRVRVWTLATLPMLVGSASDEISARMAVLVLGSLGNETDAGLFQAAARLSLMTIFFLRVITSVAAARISALFHEGRWDALRASYWRLCALSFAGALPFFLLFWIFPEYVLSWFGPGFEGAVPILRLLSLGYLASAAAGPCATALMMIGRERVYGVLACASLLVYGLASYVLASRYGGIGAAVAASSVLVLNNGLYVAVFYWATSPGRMPSDAPTHTAHP